MRQLLLSLIMAITSAVALHGATADSLRVSLITCYPGPEVYELCGHEAVRIRTATTDSVWNYGIFDFNAPHFLYRFTKGETDYMLASYPFSFFLPEYLSRGSRVVEHELNLTQTEARKLQHILQTKALPSNRVYRYNYVRDNCSTRIFDNLDSSASSRIIYPDTIRYGTFRTAMRHYHRNYPWYQFGIDLALGSDIDKPIGAREEMFAPVRVPEMVEGAHFADGRRLVSRVNVLNEGSDATLGPTPWYLTPLFWSWVFFTLTACTAIWGWKRRRQAIAFCSAFFFLQGLAGCLLAFLVFISVHEATSPNALIWWLNPLGIVIGALVWIRRADTVTRVLMALNSITAGLLLVAWAFQPQSANPAFFPLMGASLLLSASYAITGRGISYNTRGKGANKPAARRTAQKRAPSKRKK